MSSKLTSHLKRLPDFLTTGQIASYCGVNFRTVIRWIKRGLLEAQRLPGRGDHRVTLTHFLEFLEKNNLSIPEELKNKPMSSHPDSQQDSSRILIVDDDPITAGAIQRVLKLNGFETLVAQDGFEAGLCLEKFNPSLMTLDLLMQKVDGISVLKTLYHDRRYKKLKVIVISGDTDSKIQMALELGASKALKKPFSNKELIQAVTELIGVPDNSERGAFI